VSLGSSTEPSPRATFARRGNSHGRRDLTWLLLVLLILSPMAARAGARGAEEPRPQRQAEPNPPAGGGQKPPGQAGPHRPAGGKQQPQHPGMGFFQRLRELPPAQQRYIMENNPQFLRLPPERQEMIRDRLRMWNQMSPQQKERVREREEIFQGLSPAQRQEARFIFPQYRDLTPLRRQAVLVAFRHLRDLPPDQRQAYLNSQYVREQYSPHERDILTGLNKLLPGSNPPGPEEPEP
jgi:hypothetical protein